MMTVLVWSRFINQTFVACTKTGTPLFRILFGHTVLPVYGHHPAMNCGRFITFSTQKVDNTSLLLNRRILKHERHPVLTHTTASIGQRSLSELLLPPGPTSGGVVTLKTGRQEVTGSNPGCACRLSRSLFSVVFSETRVNTG